MVRRGERPLRRHLGEVTKPSRERGCLQTNCEETADYIMCVYVCVYMCVYVCVCYGEVAASISSLANWCMVLCIYTNVHIKIVWVCCIHPAQLQTLRVIDFRLSGLSLLCCSPLRQACCC